MENKRYHLIIIWTCLTAQTLLVIFFMRLENSSIWKACQVQDLTLLMASPCPGASICVGFSCSLNTPVHPRKWMLHFLPLEKVISLFSKELPASSQASLMQCLYVEWPLPSLFLRSSSHSSRSTSNLNIFCENFHHSPRPKGPSALPSAPVPSHYATPLLCTPSWQPVSRCS